MTRANLALGGLLALAAFTIFLGYWQIAKPVVDAHPGFTGAIKWNPQD